MPVANESREPTKQERLATGPQGVQGIRGERGERGSEGPPGPRGPKGDKGDPGDRGATGPPGQDGARGAEGPLGGRGADGPRGPMGLAGPQGKPGPAGPQGEASKVPGPQGEPGAKGAKGDTGEPGPQGDRGPTGPQGDAGPAGLPAYRTAKTPDDQTSTSTSLKDVLGLSLDAEPDTDYAFEFTIPYMGDPVLKLEGPASSRMLAVREVRTDELITLTGLLSSGPKGGTLQVRFRPASAGSAVTIGRGALVRWHTY